MENAQAPVEGWTWKDIAQENQHFGQMTMTIHR